MIEQETHSVTRAEVAIDVFDILGSVLLVEPRELVESQQLFAELQVESIDILDILTHLESRFGVPSGLDLPFLERAFFEDKTGHFVEGHLTDTGKKVLEHCVFLNALLLDGNGAKAYLLSISSLVDLAHGWARTTDRP